LFSFSSIHDYQEGLKQGSISCQEAVSWYLERISRMADLNAYVRVYAKEALETAGRLDSLRKAGHKTGRLHGVIIGVKDVLCIKDQPVTAGSGILQGFKPL